MNSAFLFKTDPSFIMDLTRENAAALAALLLIAGTALAALVIHRNWHSSSKNKAQPK